MEAKKREKKVRNTEHGTRNIIHIEEDLHTVLLREQGVMVEGRWRMILVRTAVCGVGTVGGGSDHSGVSDTRRFWCGDSYIGIVQY